MSVFCFINLTFPELFVLLCGLLCITAKLYMLFLGCNGKGLFVFKQVYSGPRYQYMYNFLGDMGSGGRILEGKGTTHHFATAKYNCCFCIWRKIMPVIHHMLLHSPLPIHSAGLVPTVTLWTANQLLSNPCLMTVSSTKRS